ncbi:aspartate aminotransferase family protein [Conexibacter stalactiti]|uniref:Aspartate aminotransferase family protein n=1 Tax=Conexibacter stalactiti TaxID=1940611 RepID=A0ABU4HS87_9ACTN|nr:aspartate aminotransferase family protein [Conexibacter stalactiti]MDW5596178.1 aspartate aminotransferase family protein [Conexibacter stalactiti]MEC5036820.1 aspartate aminotransferase family protein [Conexibacter stalactiti]
MTHSALHDSAREHLLLHFTNHAAAYGGERDLLVLERGEGPYVFDTAGNRYVDALSSLFCSQLGYSYGEEIAAVASAQMRKLAFNTNWATAHPPAIALAEKLAEIMPGDLNHVFFTNGGSESVETMWKIVREYFTAKGEPRRLKAIARDRAYHGVTLGALSFTGVPGFKEPFGRPAIDVTHVSNTNAFRAPDGADPAAHTQRLLTEVRDAIVAAGPDEVAIIIAEPVQNAGGCLVAPPGYWAGLRALADEFGALLVADEVICGFGRLGHWLGSEREGIVPDVATTAKGITAAYAPMGAVLVADRVAEAIHGSGLPLRHGITFGGHPVSAAVALKSIEIFERDGVLENVRANEAYLEARLAELRALPIVGDTRGRGYFWAMELVGDAENRTFDKPERDRLLRGFLPGRLLDAGLIARADDRGDSVLQIAPPLISDRAVLDEIVDRLAEVLTDAGTFMGVESAAATAAA